MGWGKINPIGGVKKGNSNIELVELFIVSFKP
jgi:hypothetical protein